MSIRVWSQFGPSSQVMQLASIKSETMWLNAVLTHAIMLAGKQYINLSRNHLDFIQNEDRTLLVVKGLTHTHLPFCKDQQLKLAFGKKQIFSCVTEIFAF